MTVSWGAYRRARRRSRQAWALLAVLAVSVLASAVWFFTAGQFAAAEPAVGGPAHAPVFDGTWMKPVVPVYPVPQGSARAALEGLAVKGRAPKDNYQREAFGQAWLDVDRNGCDTRNDILRRDLASVGFMEGSKCRVASGAIVEPYTGKAVDFRRGPESSKEVQIDHVVALGDAWQKGAQGLTPQQRQQPGQRSSEPHRRRRSRQPAEGRGRCRHLAAEEQEHPLPLRGPPDIGEGVLWAVGHAAGEGCHDPRPGLLSGTGHDRGKVNGELSGPRASPAGIA